MSGFGSKRAIAIAYLLVGLVAALAGLSIYQMSPQPSDPGALETKAASPKPLVGTRRPDFSLPDAHGKASAISRWDGDVVLVNFWATWCVPCRREMPVFADLQGQYGRRGFQVVGVAIDRADAVREFAAGLGVDYPQLVGLQEAMTVADRYGNRYGALPYSVLIDRRGIIRFVKHGELSRQELELQLLKLL